MLQLRDRSRGNLFAPFLHEMSGINEFERLRTAADVTTKRAHDRRSEDRISHADRHDARRSPFNNQLTEAAFIGTVGLDWQFPRCR